MKDLPIISEAAFGQSASSDTAPATDVGGSPTPEQLSVVRWPEGFRMTETGLFCEGPPVRQRTAGASPEIWVCAPFEVLGEARDAQGTDWGLVLRWPDRDGRLHSWSVPKRLLHSNGNEIAAELEKNGLRCGIDHDEHRLLKRAISGLQTNRRLQAVHRSGWHMVNGVSAFVLPDGRAFGPTGSEVVLQGEMMAGPEGPDFRHAGTLQEWQAGIGEACIGNSRLILAISTALAGPLLDIANEQSGGLHLLGQSQSGKSTLLFAAGSVWGCGERGAQVQMWRATTNGLEAVASASNDTVLVLDEISQASAAEVSDAVYTLMNSAGKLRANRRGGSRRPAVWRLIVLSSGEITLAAKLAEAGRNVTAGLEVRLLEVDADAGAGMGVFERLHRATDPGAMADHLREAARTWFGTAGPAFVVRLAAERASRLSELRSWLADQIDRFVTQHLPPGADGQTRTAVRRFALIAAAGELAAQYGVLPWPKEEATKGVGRCCVAWLANRGGAGPREDAIALEQVQAFIEEHGASRFVELDENGAEVNSTRPVARRAGWRKRTPNGFEYWILPSVWKKDVCAGINPSRAGRLLRDRGKLVDCDPGHPAARRMIPNEGRMRVYVLRHILQTDDDPGSGS